MIPQNITEALERLGSIEDGRYAVSVYKEVYADHWEGNRWDDERRAEAIRLGDCEDVADYLLSLYPGERPEAIDWKAMPEGSVVWARDGSDIDDYEVQTVLGCGRVLAYGADPGEWLLEDYADLCGWTFYPSRRAALTALWHDQFTAWLKTSEAIKAMESEVVG